MSGNHENSSSMLSTQPGGGAVDLNDGTLVPEHFIPIPRTVSPEAQEILRRPYPAAQPSIPASKNDVEVWRAVRAGDDGIALMASGYVEQYPAEIITHQLSACTL